MLYICFVLLVLLFYSPFLIYKKYISKNYTSYENCKLDENAKIISVDVDIVGLKGEHKYRTTVRFDDGFEYISHDGTAREDNLLTYKITLSADTKQHIINEAIKKHRIAIEKAKTEYELDNKYEFEDPNGDKKCDMCQRKFSKLTKCKIVDSYGTRYRDLCKNCIHKYNAISLDNKNTDI